MDPVSFGGSDAPVQEPAANVEPTNTPETSKFEGFSDFASPILNEVSPEHRAIVAPYLKKWDGAVTQKFQENAKKLKPYEELGSYDDVAKFTNFARNFSKDPEKAFAVLWSALAEQYGEEFADVHLPRILGLEEGMSDEQELNQVSDEPDPNEVFQQNVTSELEELRQFKTQYEESQQQAQLDKYLTDLHNKVGDFNDDFFLLKVSEGMQPQDALKAWNDEIQKYSQNGARRQAPVIMGGQGGVPTGQVDVTKLRGQERRAAVMNALSAIDNS